MKSDDILDAIGLVDDEYVKKAKENQKKHKPVWITMGTIAACLGGLIISGVVLFNSDIFDFGGSKNYAGSSGSSNEVCGDSGDDINSNGSDYMDPNSDFEDSEQIADMVVGSNNSSEIGTNYYPGTSIVIGSHIDDGTIFNPPAYVEIVEWNEESFVGKITDNELNSIYDGYTDLIIEFSQDVYIYSEGEDSSEIICRKPTIEDFPVGSIVYVEFENLYDEIVDGTKRKGKIYVIKLAN